MDLKRVPKWAWIAAGLTAVVVFYYFHKRAQANSTGATATNTQNTDGGVDESQLSSDIAAQLAAALGGTPQGVDNGAVSPQDDSALIASLLQMLQQSQDEFGQFATSMVGSGVGGAGQSPGSAFGVGATGPTATGGEVTSPAQAAPAAQPAPVYSPTPSGFIPVAPVGGIASAAYNPSTGFTLTPQGVAIPSTNYGTPTKPLTGPSIFAFK